MWLGLVVLTLQVSSIDFDGDGDVGTDADIEKFFACLSAPSSECPNTDLDGDGDVGTDADIQEFFRLLAGGDPRPPVTIEKQRVREVTQHGVTFRFDREVPACQFHNGDYAVQGPVTITQITPNISYTSVPNGSGNVTVIRNGYTVNPTMQSMYYQSYDNRIGSYDERFRPALPLNIQSDSSIIKAISISDPAVHCPREDSGTEYNKWGTCIDRVAVLTVLNQLPSDDCANYFRPAYAGTSKRLRRVSDLNLSSIPSLAPRAGLQGTQSLADLSTKFKPVFLDHLHNGDNMSQMRSRQHALKADGTYEPGYGAYSYGPRVAGLFYEAIFRTMIQMPGENFNEGNPKRNFLNLVLQTGVDTLELYRMGKTWNIAAGHGSYILGLLTFAAIVLDDREIQNMLSTRPLNHFAETAYTNTAFITGPRRDANVPAAANDQRVVYLFGDAPTSMEHYWLMQFRYGGGQMADPHRRAREFAVDGDGGERYQACCMLGVAAQSTLAHLWPQARTLMEANGRFPGTTNYGDRIKTFGAYVVDECAATRSNGQYENWQAEYQDFIQNIYMRTMGPLSSNSSTCIPPSSTTASKRFSERVTKWDYIVGRGWVESNVPRHGWVADEPWTNAFVNSVRSNYLHCSESPVDSAPRTPWFRCQAIP